jgi:hypothetical protein
MTRNRKCRMCPSQNARDVEIRVRIGDTESTWQVHICKWDWRSFEAMLDSADPIMAQPEMFSDGRRVRWMW